MTQGCKRIYSEFCASSLCKLLLRPHQIKVKFPIVHLKGLFCSETLYMVYITPSKPYQSKRKLSMGCDVTTYVEAKWLVLLSRPVNRYTMILSASNIVNKTFDSSRLSIISSYRARRGCWQGFPQRSLRNRGRSPEICNRGLLYSICS